MNSNDSQAYVSPSKNNDLLELYEQGKITREEYQAEVRARDEAQAAEVRKRREQEQIIKDNAYLKDRVKFFQRTTVIGLVAFVVALIFAISNGSSASKYKDTIEEKNEIIGLLASEAQTKYENASEKVYVTDTGKMYHRQHCGYLRSSNEITLKSAIDSGYSRCSRCNPPVLKEIEK